MKILFFKKKIIFLFFILVCNTVAVCGEKETQKAIALIKVAGELKKQNHLDDALKLLDAAYKIAPMPLILWNKARIYEIMKKPRKALYWFYEFAKVNDEKYVSHKQVNQKIKQLWKIVPPLISVVGFPDFATIILDNSVQHKKIIEKEVKSGQHFLTISAIGYKKQQIVFSIKSGQNKKIEFTLERLRQPIIFTAIYNDKLNIQIDGHINSVIDVPGKIELETGEHEIKITGSNCYKLQTFHVTARNKPIKILLTAISNSCSTLAKSNKKHNIAHNIKSAISVAKISNNSGSSYLGWIIFGTGVGIAGLGTYFTAHGFSVYHTLTSAKQNEQGIVTSFTGKEAENIVNRARKNVIIGYSLIGTGAVTVGIGVAFIITELLQPKSRNKMLSFGISPIQKGALGVWKLKW